jgi:hypothetical protein
VCHGYRVEGPRKYPEALWRNGGSSEEAHVSNDAPGAENSDVQKHEEREISPALPVGRNS